MKPKRGFQSVVQELIDGLENGTIAIEGTAAKAANGQVAEHPPIMPAPLLKKIVRDSEREMPGRGTA